MFETNDPQSKIKICDFGFAKSDIGNALETPIGTVAYVAPEVLSQDRYSKSVDLWSLGCILYFMLVGRPPFYSEKEEEIETLVSIGKYSFPETAKISDDAKDLIHHLLETDPIRRYTATEALQHPWFRKYDETDKISEHLEKIRIISSSKQNISQIRGAINKAIDSRREKDDNICPSTKQATFTLAQAVQSTVWTRRQQKKQTRSNILATCIENTIQQPNSEQEQQISQISIRTKRQE